jgi:hypothetical protein
VIDAPLQELALLRYGLLVLTGVCHRLLSLGNGRLSGAQCIRCALCRPGRMPV